MSVKSTNGRLARIVGTGAYLPVRILSNQDLEKMVDTSDEWIFTRTGMKERHIARFDEFTSDMGYDAAKKALEKSGITPEQIDVIIFATLTPDFIFPSTAALLQHRLGATKAAAFDIQAACTGYVYGLSLAKAFIESGMYNNVLLVASEKLSSITNYQDRNTCILFGDGAAASVISSQGNGLAIRDVCLGTDGEQAEILLMPAGGCRLPASQETLEKKLHYITMGGKEVFKHAVRRMENAAKECLDQCKLSEEEISWLVPHQANERIIDAIAKRFNVPNERVYKTVQKYGNTSASSVALALHDLLGEHTIQPSENILLVAFGAGLTWGASILTQLQES
jgi:3-oxoacyl-[acyl-carrier-protein] synthase-3